MEGYDAFDLPTTGRFRAYRLLVPDVDWFAEALNTALTELGDIDNWFPQGTADVDYCTRMGVFCGQSLRRSVEMLGFCFPFAGALLPQDCLWCDGAQYRQADYPDLCALIGGIYGGADAGYFRVPDLRGRVLVGVGAGAGLSNRNLADTFGEEQHALSTGEMPAHNHPDTGHYHTTGNSLTGVALTPGELPVLVPNPIPALTGSGTAAVTSAGGGDSHNNLQPSIALNFVIVAVAS